MISKLIVVGLMITSVQVSWSADPATIHRKSCDLVVDGIEDDRLNQLLERRGYNVIPQQVLHQRIADANEALTGRSSSFRYVDFHRGSSTPQEIVRRQQEHCEIYADQTILRVKSGKSNDIHSSLVLTKADCSGKEGIRTLDLQKVSDKKLRPGPNLNAQIVAGLPSCVSEHEHIFSQSIDDSGRGDIPDKTPARVISRPVRSAQQN